MEENSMSLKSCEKTGTNEVTIELSISAEAFADANTKAYNKVKKNISVPGFRKGKAPKAFIEKYYGEGVFYDDALEIAFPDAFEAAVAEAGIDPVDNPFDFDIKSVGKDGVELSCKVTVKPEIELGEYKGLKAEKEVVAVTAEEVEAEYEKIAAGAGVTVEEVKKHYEDPRAKEYLEDEAKEQKLYTMLFEQVKVSKGDKTTFADLFKPAN